VPLAPRDVPGRPFREVSPRRTHSFGYLWGLTFDTFRFFFVFLFFGAVLNGSFRFFTAATVPKVAKKGAKVEPKGIPQRLRDPCQKHGIYYTGSTSDPPGSIPKPDVSSKPSPEASWMAPEAHLCDSWHFGGPPLGGVLPAWSRLFSVPFFHAFPERPLTSSTGRWQARGCQAGEGDSLFGTSLDRIGTEVNTIRQASGLRPGAADIGAQRRARHRAMGSFRYRT
jgi:hypothetical protein